VEQGIAVRIVCWRSIGLLLLLVATYGCGYRRPPLAQVEALVTLDGEPVAGADVLLVPTGSGRAARGLTDDAGRLGFSAYGSGDGIPAGTYRAVVSKRQLSKRGVRKMESLRSMPASSDDAAPEPMIEFADSYYENLLPEQYATIATSGIVVKIDLTTRQITLPLVSSPANAPRERR
jgi:hypothetical protein